MFKKETVFILGAGASWHYGQPTGEDLVRFVRAKAEQAQRYFIRSVEQPIGVMPKYVLRKLRVIEARADLAPADQYIEAWKTAAHDCDQLTKRLRSVDPLVIDYFLGQNEELQDLGRMLIAWVLRECETGYKHACRNINRIAGAKDQDNWLRFIVHRLVVGCKKPEQLFDNKVIFVTFNYDVSLEDNLRDALRSNSFFNPGDVDEFLSSGRILHIYGKIRGKGNPEFVAQPPLEMSSGNIEPLFAKSFFDELSTSAEGIRTIDPHDKTDDEILLQARGAIRGAQCLYILGFGFDSNNCLRLGLEPGTFQVPTSSLPKSVLFTNYQNSNRVNKAASRAFLGYADAFLLDKTSLDQRNNRGCYYEKSIRDCYGALALDFDEVEEY